MTDQDSLTLWLEIETNRRKHTEALLKAHGLTWNKFKEVEQEAITQIPPEGIEFGEYHVVVSETPVHEFKLSDSKVIDTKKHISLHKKR